MASQSLAAIFVRSLILFAFLNARLYFASAQVNPDKNRQAVLRHIKVGKTYIFDCSKKDDHNRTELTYLGKLKTRNGRVFKIVISRWYWGLASRATSRIVVFNDQNKYLGNYYVGMTYDLPCRIENNSLIFENKSREGCDAAIVTRLSFAKGLPRQFFLECKDKMGDIYQFSTE